MPVDVILDIMHMLMKSRKELLIIIIDPFVSQEEEIKREL
jgi:hypothetical protein